jgi:drug/metabolite transporter (DMT)-like permease
LRRSTLLLVLPYVGSTLLYVWANKMTTAANAIFLQATYPLWVMLLAPWLLGERPGPRDFGVTACIAAGMWLCTSGTEQSATAPDPAFGNAVALASGLSFGLLMIGFRWLGRRGRGEQPAVVAWGNMATVLIAGSLSGGLPYGGAADWLVILYLGVFQVACGYLLLMRGTALVPALQASLLMMAEPALNPVWAYLVHGENPGRNAILGGALIVGAVALGNLRRA